ncbi:MAG: hypothetical protein LV479_10235 [Methylacidiphilales bacterium]|nr:hypothetical protein [Candidatus Methylacidiphilales bacterium]
MRVYEVVLRSGAKAEIAAEALVDDVDQDNKVYFYRDKGSKKLAAYFVREEIAGILIGPDNVGSVPVPK